MQVSHQGSAAYHGNLFTTSSTRRQRNGHRQYNPLPSGLLVLFLKRVMQRSLTISQMVAGKHTFSHFKYNYSEPKSMFY
jgi:hypothetical protein